VKAVATAKLEAVAKATYSRNRTITEVIPPDVTRAKNGAWLDLFSPITQWAGLKGDALQYRRQQLRIQQEDTLLRLGEELRRKMVGLEVVEPVVPKILVPALEKASLEDPSDKTMIERWANLLASATQKVLVQPRFVSILSELAGSQAECLEIVAFQYCDGFPHPYAYFVDSSVEFSEVNATTKVKEFIEFQLDKDLSYEDIPEAIAKLFETPGVAFGAILAYIGPDLHHADGTTIGKEADLAILESLGLIREDALSFDFQHKKTAVTLQIHYHHLTDLGVAFCEVCSRPRILELRKVDRSNGGSWE